MTADLNDPRSLTRAIGGAHAVFLVTHYWEHLNKDKEITQVRETGLHSSSLSLSACLPASSCRTLSVCLHLSLCLSAVCLFVCLPASLSVCRLFVSLSASLCLSGICLSVSLTLSASFCLSVFLCLPLSVSPSVSPSVCLSLSLSVSLFFLSFLNDAVFVYSLQ